MSNRSMFREEAKRIYKEQVKNVPRRKRIPFSQFFKQYKKMKATQRVAEPEVSVEEEDFNLDSLVTMNDLNEGGDDIDLGSLININDLNESNDDE